MTTMATFWASPDVDNPEFFARIEKMVGEESRRLIAEDVAVFAVKFADFRSFRDDVNPSAVGHGQNTSIVDSIAYLYCADGDITRPVVTESARYLVGHDPSGRMTGVVIGDKRIEEMVMRTDGCEHANTSLIDIVFDHISIFGVDPVKNALSLNPHVLADVANEVVDDGERARSVVWSILLGRLTFGMNDFSLKSEHVEMLEEMEKNRDKTLLSLADAVRANLPEVTGEYLSEPDLSPVDAVAVHESAEIMRAHIADEWRRHHRNRRP